MSLSALLCAGVTGCEQKPAAAAAPPPAPNSEQVAKFKYEMDEKCAADARAWFKANYSEPTEPMKVQSGGEITSGEGIDQNHYSRKLNACFAVLVTTTTFPAPKAQIIQSNGIFDVNENRRIGVLVQKDFQTVTACDVEGTKCSSKAEFESMVRDYLVE
jgi:hypothetical protein